MAKKELRRIEITPAENGGHTVEHNYKPQAKNTPRNGMSMEYQEPESHVFGPKDHEKMLLHVANALGLKPSGKEDE